MKLRIIALVATFAMVFVPQVLAGGPEVAELAKVEEAEITGIRNFSQIVESVGFAGPKVGFGGATAPGAMPALKSMGYTSVINLRLSDEENVALESSQSAASAAGINYIHLPFDPENASPDVINKFLETVADPENQPVYIHCNSATRVAALWMIGRVSLDHWDQGIARAEVQKIAGTPDESIAFATAYLSKLQK